MDNLKLGSMVHNYIESIITDDDHWDCECEKRFIHKVKDRSICPKCNADFHDGMPNSRVNEMTDKSRFYKGGNNG